MDVNLLHGKAWAGIMHDKLIGPFFFLEKTGHSYLDTLELCALPQLPPQTILQQYGVPPHFCHHVRNYLDRDMAGRWIGRGGPIAWPPRSPDLTPLDFFFAGLCEEHCLPGYLKACIREAVAMVTPNMLQAMWDEVEYRLDICPATKGAHTEIYCESYILRKKLR
jgi:hypothetical protein